MPALGPVRSREQLGAGVLCAPLGCVALGVLVVAGLPTLQAWDKVGGSRVLGGRLQSCFVKKQRGGGFWYWDRTRGAFFGDD